MKTELKKGDYAYINNLGSKYHMATLYVVDILQTCLKGEFIGKFKGEKRYFNDKYMRTIRPCKFHKGDIVVSKYSRYVCLFKIVGISDTIKGGGPRYKMIDKHGMECYSIEDKLRLAGETNNIARSLTEKAQSQEFNPPMDAISPVNDVVTENEVSVGDEKQVEEPVNDQTDNVEPATQEQVDDGPIYQQMTTWQIFVLIFQQLQDNQAIETEDGRILKRSLSRDAMEVYPNLAMYKNGYAQNVYPMDDKTYGKARVIELEPNARPVTLSEGVALAFQGHVVFRCDLDENEFRYIATFFRDGEKDVMTTTLREALDDEDPEFIFQQSDHITGEDVLATWYVIEKK